MIYICLALVFLVPTGTTGSLHVHIRLVSAIVDATVMTDGLSAAFPLLALALLGTMATVNPTDPTGVLHALLPLYTNLSAVSGLTFFSATASLSLLIVPDPDAYEVLSENLATAMVPIVLPVVSMPGAAMSVGAMNPDHRFPILFVLVIGGVIATQSNNGIPGHVLATVLHVGAALAVTPLTPVNHLDDAMDIDDPDYPMEDDRPRDTVLHPEDPMDIDVDM